jgi:hypothetical protein
LILISLEAFTQSEGGYTVGVNYSVINLENATDSEQNGKIGGYAGIFRNFKVTNKLVFKPELIFSLQRTQYIRKFDPTAKVLLPIAFQSEDGQIQYIDTVDVNINEFLIQIPLMLELTLGQNFILGAGPQIEYLMSENISNNDNGIYNFGELDSYKLGLSYAASIGYKFNDRINISFRYLNRFSNRNLLKGRTFHVGFYQRF